MRMPRIYTALLFSMFFVASCAHLPPRISKNWSTTESIQHSATIKLHYDFYYSEYVTLGDESYPIALGQCKAWGYADVAQKGTTESCIETGLFGMCLKKRVTREYQCFNAISHNE